MSKLARNQNRDLYTGTVDQTETGPCGIRTVARVVGSNRPLLDQRDIDRMTRGARNFVQGNKSDPFVAQRVAAHMKSGISGIHFDEKGKQIEAFYDAKIGMETRSIVKTDGEVEKYNVEVIVDMKGP